MIPGGGCKRGTPVNHAQILNLSKLWWIYNHHDVSFLAKGRRCDSQPPPHRCNQPPWLVGNFQPTSLFTKQAVHGKKRPQASTNASRSAP